MVDRTRKVTTEEVLATVKVPWGDGERPTDEHIEAMSRAYAHRCVFCGHEVRHKKLLYVGRPVCLFCRLSKERRRRMGESNEDHDAHGPYRLRWRKTPRCRRKEGPPIDRTVRVYLDRGVL